MKHRIWLPITVMVISIGLLVTYLYYSRAATDSVAPVITVADPERIPRISVKDPQAVLLEGVTAKDDRDGDVSASLVVEDLGLISQDQTITVTYAAFDKAGNVSKAQRQLRYTDYIGPRFQLSAPLVYTFGAHFDVLNQIQVTDPLDGDIRHKVKTMLLDDEALTAEGIHEVRFRVTNSLGDMEELILPVEVQYSGRFNAQLQLTQYLVYLKAGAKFTPERYLSQVVLRGSAIHISSQLPEGATLKTEGTVNTAKSGVYPVSYTLSGPQDGGWSAYSKLIVVVEE